MTNRRAFTVTSDTWDYLAARRAVAEGKLTEVGRAQLPGGVVAATFAEAVANESRQLEVRLDPREFIKVLRDYSDWQVKWWREAVQNSVDAGATKIHLKAIPTEDGLGMVISCTDNGRGMTPDVFENKFLVFGGSGKEESTTTVGGWIAGVTTVMDMTDWL